MSTSKPAVFVLMPFDASFDKIYRDLIYPSLERAGYDVIRADSELNQQNILKDIVLGIAKAKLIVVDMTGLNANVMYELGIAHGIGKPVVLLTQSISELPFDLRPYRVISYTLQYDDVAALKESLHEIGAKHLRDEIEFGSPVSDFYLPT